MINLREELTKAGNTWDGHVTNGSLTEQMKVIEAYIKEQDDRQRMNVTWPKNEN